MRLKIVACCRKRDRGIDGTSSILMVLFLALTAAMLGNSAHAQRLEHIRVSNDGTHFVRESTGHRFVVWGVNYDHDGAGRLIDEYWIAEWQKVVQDLREIKELGANCVRIHLQVGKFMDGPNQPNAKSLKQLKKLVALAEELRLHLDVTGLACYHKKNIPPWYDKLPEQDRWAVQARFWEAIARVCAKSPAIFCYDLMNEPILPGKKPATDWLTGKLGGKFFVQRLTLNLKGRSRRQVAQAWVNRMVDAIRNHDKRHMITVGVIPWVFAFGGGKPLFYSPTVGKRLDFVAVHFYPEKNKINKALEALLAYEVGKPVVVEEMFPLKCSQDELVEFVRKSSKHVDGWISFYWGTTAKELKAKKKPTIAEAMIASWLEKYKTLAREVAR